MLQQNFALLINFQYNDSVAYLSMMYVVRREPATPANLSPQRTKWQWDRLCSKYFSVPQYLTFL
jgi:hypothetical protein